MTDQVISHDGLALIENFEGCKLVAYQDSTGVWTIGYGHTSGAGSPLVHAGMQITQAEAQVILSNDLEKFEAIVRKHVTHVLTQHEFDALVSFVFNLGEPNFAKSTLLRMVNAGNMAGAKTQFARWTRAGGVVLQGLVRRRAAEASLFAAPDTPGAVAQAPTKPTVQEDMPPLPPQGGEGVPSDILSDLTKQITDTVGSVFPPAGSSPSASDPSFAAEQPDTGPDIMNPISGMLAGAKIASTALPLLFNVASHLGAHLPDIEAKFADLVARLEHAYASATHLDLTSAKADLGAAWADGMAIYDDIGLPREDVMKVIGIASKDNTAPGFAAEAAAVLSGLIGKIANATIPVAKPATA